MVNVNENVKVSVNNYSYRYLVFAFDYYDSYGGLGDCKGSFNSREELLDILNEHFMYDSYQILDIKTGSTLSLCANDFDGTLDLCDNICKSLLELTFERSNKELNDFITNYIDSFSNDNVQAIINNLKVYSIGFKNSGLLEPYINIEILLSMLKDGDLCSFIKLLPNVIKSLDKSNVSKSIIEYLNLLH